MGEWDARKSTHAGKGSTQHENKREKDASEQQQQQCVVGVNMIPCKLNYNTSTPR